MIIPFLIAIGIAVLLAEAWEWALEPNNWMAWLSITALFFIVLHLIN
ncbi:MAG: hypothetical protein ACSHWQ_00110 [Spongiibacteraceae bacterium]